MFIGLGVYLMAPFATLFALHTPQPGLSRCDEGRVVATHQTKPSHNAWNLAYGRVGTVHGERTYWRTSCHLALHAATHACTQSATHVISPTVEKAPRVCVSCRVGG